jgi:hypothetical protein
MQRVAGLELLTSCVALLAIVAPVHGQPVVINEVLASTTGTDVEYVELFGTPATSLAGLSLVVVEAESNSNQSTFTFRLDFDAADALGENGFFLIGNALVTQTYAVTPNRPISDNSFQNQSETFALVATASLAGNAVAGGETVLDAVALAGPASSLPGAVYAFGAPVVGPDGSFFPAGVRRIADGVDTDSPTDWVIADFDLGSANTPMAAATPPPTPMTLTIPEVQGPGAQSPYVGEHVVVEGVVVGDFQADGYGSDGSVGGFYLQDLAGDANAATSDGVFVFDGFAPAVDVGRGDRVRVTGTVAEFFGETQIAEVAAVETIATGVANLVSHAAHVTLPTPTIMLNADGRPVGDLEAYEGMLVEFLDPLTVSEYFNLDRFGEIRLAQGGRLVQFTQGHAPDVTGFAAHVEDVAARTIMLDDGLTLQNPDPIRYPAPGLDTANTFRGGDQVLSLTGVVRYSRGSGGSGDETYRLLPIVEPIFVPLNTRPAPPTASGRLRIASFNVLNYFNTLDDGTERCGTPSAPQECRGADAAFGTAELERQTAKLVTAIAALDADVLGLTEIENDYGDGVDSSAATLVEALNTALGADVYAYVDPGVAYLGDDAIAVGLLYKPAAVALNPGTIVATLDDSRLDSLGLGAHAPLFNGEATSRVPLAAAFVDNETQGAFTVVVNHLKSKGDSGLTDPADPNFDQGDGQGFWNSRRTDAARALERWLATDPTGSRDPDVVILGDLNAYAMEDPVAALLAAGYADPLDRASDPGDRYSYVFDGQLGTLDYALISTTLEPQVNAAAIWAVNADEPDGLDYNLDFGRPPGLFDGSVPYRSSDHDPVVLSLQPFAPGDFDGDGRLSLVGDLLDLLSALHSREGQHRYDPSLDLDLNRRIDARDALIWLQLFKESRR